MRYLCSIVILSFNQVEFTKNCLDSIRKNTEFPYEIIVVDNNSNSETKEFLRSQEDIILYENIENMGFAGGCNIGMKLAHGDYILLLNNDTIVTKGYLKNMVTLMESDNQIGIVGPLTNNTIGKQKLSVDLSYHNVEEIEAFGKTIAESSNTAEQVVRLIGFCMLIRRNFIEEVGMFDEGFKIGNYEDDDLCIRALLQNKKLFICKTSFVYHYKRATFDNNKLPFEEISLNNKLYLENKWKDINWNYYSINNPSVISEIVNNESKRVLHFNCGLGTMGLELKSKINCTIVGVEYHDIRRKIAEQFYDEIHVWDDNLKFIEDIKDQNFDVVILENVLEKVGVQVLNRVKKFLKEDTILIVRIFNKQHISVIENILFGSTWGRMLSAASKEFNYLYGKEIEREFIDRYNLQITKCIEVKKELRKTQNDIYQAIKGIGGYDIEGLIYNRLYIMKLRE